MTALALLSLLVLSSVSWTGTDAQLAISDGKPISYTLHLEPNITKGRFNGTVTIDFVVTNETSVLVLNQKNLKIKNIELVGNTIREFNVINEKHILVIYCNNVLVKHNNYSLKIEYSGILNKYRAGFYRRRYFVGNETKWIASTHFQPTNARLAFPCWDEPIYKATFDISITHLKNYTTVLSNMPVMNKTDNGHTFTTFFERTMRMPTYLVAFTVSDYVYRSDPSNKFTIYTTPDSVRHMEYALRFSVKVMDQLDEYTALPYFKIMPKMDEITITDFNGAMENWGLVTYRESYLLYEKGVTTTSDKEFLSTTIAHEFVHQWFGNLVTPSSWKFIWLSEGFANYFQFHITEKAGELSGQRANECKIDSSSQCRGVHTDIPEPTSIVAALPSDSALTGGGMGRHWTTSVMEILDNEREITVPRVWPKTIIVKGYYSLTFAERRTGHRSSRGFGLRAVKSDTGSGVSVEPTWRLVDLFAVESLQWNAFMLDGKLDTRALNKEATTPWQIWNLFDGTAYYKGGCIIRMFSHILTQQVFQTALRNYLRANSFESADSDNLIEHFQNAAGKDKRWDDVSLSEIAETWLTQPGYPVVTVKKNNPGRYSLTQTRFLYYETDEESKWWIPISYVTNDNLNFTDTSPTYWMNPKKKYLTISETKADWILVNKQQTGYYRVNYDDEIWQSLSKYLKSNMHLIHPVNRAQLIDDALTMARKNLTKYETALSLTLYLTNETDYIPWMTTFKHLDFLRNLIFPSSHYHIFKHYVRYIMHGLTKNLTYEAFSKADHPTKILTAHAMKWACFADVKECLDYANKEFNAWVKNPNYHLDVDLKDAIICTGLRTASEAVWDHVLKKLSESVYDMYAKTNPLEIMGCSNNHTILEKFLIISLKPESKIDFQLVVKSVIDNTNVSGIDIVLKILENVQSGMVVVNNVKDLIIGSAIGIGVAIVDSEHFLKLSRVLIQINTTLDIMGGTMKQSRRNVHWISNYGPIVSQWLANNEMLFNSGTTTLTFTSFLLIFSIFMTRYY